MQEYLAEAGITPLAEINAKKDTFDEGRAIKLVASINEIYSARGQKVVHLNVKKDNPAMEVIKKLVLGPTGNLRAPTLRVGKTLLVGFNSETCNKVFGV